MSFHKTDILVTTTRVIEQNVSSQSFHVFHPSLKNLLSLKVTTLLSFILTVITSLGFCHTSLDTAVLVLSIFFLNLIVFKSLFVYRSLLHHILFFTVFLLNSQSHLTCSTPHSLGANCTHGTVQWSISCKVTARSRDLIRFMFYLSL